RGQSRARERVTLVSEEPLSQGHGGEDESVVGRYVAPATGGVPQSVAASVVGADPRDPFMMPGNP
ncbi:hypothetical protein KI387_039301, partial [Taxus chinensis]